MWEYKTIIVRNQLPERQLNIFGRAGWELVSFAIEQYNSGLRIITNYNYIFKRPKQNPKE